MVVESCSNSKNSIAAGLALAEDLPCQHSLPWKSHWARSRIRLCSICEGQGPSSYAEHSQALGAEFCWSRHTCSIRWGASVMQSLGYWFLCWRQVLRVSFFWILCSCLARASRHEEREYEFEADWLDRWKDFWHLQLQVDPIGQTPQGHKALAISMRCFSGNGSKRLLEIISLYQMQSDGPTQ